MASLPPRPGPGRTVVALALACLCPAPAPALDVTAVTIDVSTDAGGSWATAVAPGAPIRTGDWIRVNLALRNDTGRLGNLCADPTPPGALTCPTADSGDWITENDGAGGTFPGQYWVWPKLPGPCPAACPAALHPARLDAPLSFVSADPVLTFAYNGYSYAPAGGGDETTTASWIFQAERTACGLDFRVYAADLDDHPDAFGIGVQNMQDLDGDGFLDGDGAWLDCNTGTIRGDATLDGILAAKWGGTLCITSPLALTPAAVVTSPGGRPAGVAYVGDRVELRVDAVNSGPPVSLAAGEACATFAPGLATKGAGVVAYPLDVAGACAAGFQPASPAPPVAIATGATATFTWTLTIAGRVGCGPFAAGSPGATGAGAASWILTVGDAGGCGSIAVVPAPLAVTATVWVDPDGAGGAFAPEPLGVVTPGTDFAGPVYYMGAETFEIRYTYRNASPSYSVDIEPLLGIDSPAIMVVAGPSPAGPQTLAPGASVTVGWTLARDPGGALQGCAGSPISLNATTAARGACFTQPIELRDLPFRPNDACGGGCPAGSRNLTFAAPQYVDQGSTFPVTLTLRSSANRPFVLDATAAFWMNLTPVTGAASLVTPPAGPPQAWNAGESRTFAWSYQASSVGDVLFDAGVDFLSIPPPCLPACRSGIPYCDAAFTTTHIVAPTNLKVTRFEVLPAVMCNAAGKWLTVEMDLRNAGGAGCIEVDGICGGAFPESYPAYYAPAAGPPAPPTPTPALNAIVLVPGQQQTVRFYLDADCPDPTAGIVTLGCFSGGQRLVQGHTSNCLGIPISYGEDADWGGAPPAATITTPASLAASVWTDRPAYSVGQTITVRLSVSNEGGDTLTGFAALMRSVAASGGAVSYQSGPTPAPPPTYPGSGGCMPSTPSASRDTYEWKFTALQKGLVTFTGSASGADPGCAFQVAAVTAAPAIRIADAATLECADPAAASAVVTMSVTCAGCSATGACDPATGRGCLAVSLDASNLGDVGVANLTISLGDPGSGYLAGCLPGTCAGPPGLAVLACPPAFCPGCAPAEACAPGSLGAGAGRTFTWRYLPTAPGCLRARIDVAGDDAATGSPVTCSSWTNCAAIKRRYPMTLRLLSAPARVAPGQSFEVAYETCNPGETVAALQPGQPALGLRRAADGSPANEFFDVLPPGPAALAPGGCRTDRLTVVAHRDAAPGGYDLRLPQGGQFLATDAETGWPVPGVDAGGALRFDMTDGTNRLAVEGDNRTRIQAGPVRLTWRLTSVGRGGRTTLRLYALSGDLVRSLVDRPATVEDATVEWDGRNDAGQTVAAGVYLARLDSPAWSGTAKVVILK